MGCKVKKYLHIYDWNYWWGYYRCGQDWEPFHVAEFSLAEDEAGETPFFHFDFHNLPALHQTCLLYTSNTEGYPSGTCPVGIAVLFLKARVGRLFRIFRDRP